MPEGYDVAVVGAGFTGLSAALDLARRGLKVRVIEPDETPGGLAGTFEFADGVRIEKFYHHWFNSDVYVSDLVRDLGLEGDVVTFPSRTGMYLNGRLWNLSAPLDLLRFTPLPLKDRIRLGLFVLKVRRITDWKSIEHLTIREWLEPLVGPRVYKVVWEPLVTSKFSVYADAVNAVWMWKKLVLRGSTRSQTGSEELAYFKGGFGRLAEKMADAITEAGGQISYGSKVSEVVADGDRVTGLVLEGSGELVQAREYLFTPSFPIIADIFDRVGPSDWIESLRRVHYLGNVCLVLRLNRSLSDTYWLNVNDPGFPFVGVIEHTNLDTSDSYAGSHIVFLSRYLATEDPVWAYSEEEYLAFALESLARMFPDLDPSWVIESRTWRAEYAQPITERNYSSYVPGESTPYSNASISTMAHIYPEDRGTNYAIREGRAAAAKLAETL